MLLSALLSYLGYWYLLSLAAFALGAATRGQIRHSILGAASALGTGIIVGVQGDSGIAQSALLSHIIGIPGGAAFPLLLTLVYSFAIGILGGYTGSAITSKAGGGQTAQGVQPNQNSPC
ncbi:MAG: hypothetical protein QW767_06880 [Thermoprotei archaeon]